jgi:hypothetical protein
LLLDCLGRTSADTQESDPFTVAVTPRPFVILGRAESAAAFAHIPADAAMVGRAPVCAQ